MSKCEKFGYGYMMSQVAATACGSSALDKTGSPSPKTRLCDENRFIALLPNSANNLDDSLM